MFIWEKEVLSVEWSKVVFVDDTTVELTERQLQYLVTDEMKDATAYRDLVVKEAVSDMMKIIEAHNIKKSQLEAISNALIGWYHKVLAEAIGKAFWTYDETLHHSHYMEDISVKDILRVVNQ